MIFQEPMTSLNPVLTIGRQIAETLTLHQGLDRRAALAKAVDMLRLVHIPEAERRVGEYPHQLSGGMRQRVMIAMALACNPKLLIADEPTTALDVTIQAQILDLMRELKQQIDAAIVLITHDLGVVAEMAQRVVVMYAGRKVEEAPVGDAVPPPAPPLHAGPPRLGAAARRLARPRAGAAARRDRRHGAVAQGADPGLPFAPRCAFATDICRREMPAFDEKAPGISPPASTPTGSPRHEPHGRAAAPLCVREDWSSISRSRRACCSAPSGRSMRSTASRFDIAEGETLGLVGESGCGKSTAGKTILKLIDPTAGEVRIDGERIDRLTRQRDAALPAPAAGRLPGPLLLAQPAHEVRDIVGEPLRQSTASRAAASSTSGSRSLALKVGLARRGARPLPARILRRPAPAHRHRPRSGAQPEPDHLRRAGLGARRLGAGAGDQPAWATCRTNSASPTSSSPTISRSSSTSATASRSCISARSSRSPTSAPLFTRPQHPYTEALLSAVPVPDPEARKEADHPQRRRAEPDQPALGLPLPHPLPLRLRALLEGGAGNARNPPRPPRRLPSARRADRRVPIRLRLCRPSDLTARPVIQC